MITQRTLELIRERVQLVDLFDDLKPRKSGPRHTCRCPFHDSKNPKSDALTIYPDGTFHCFSCKAHGDHFEAVMLRDGVEFSEAVERLARRAGIVVEYTGKGADEHAAAERSRKAAAFAAAEWATAWFQAQLAAPAAAEATGYLVVDRKLPPKIIADRRLGWAPGDALLTAALAAGHELPALMDAGLVVERDGRRRSFFYERIVIPITNPNGRVVAWTARALPAAITEAGQAGRSIPKYINPGETLIYSKAKAMLGLRAARDSAKDLGALVMVEGALDVLALDALGLGAGICSCGLGLSEDQAGVLGDVAGDLEVPVVLLYNGDGAGKQGSLRSAELLFRVGARTRVAMLPSEATDAHGGKHQVKDVANVWEALGAGGADLVRAAVETSQPALDYLLSKSAPAPGAMDIDQRLIAADRLLATINQIVDVERRELAIDQVGKHLDLTRAQLTRRSDRQREELTARPGAAAASPSGGAPPQGDWGYCIPPPNPAGENPPSPDQPFELNELGNALRFASRYGTRVRFVSTWGAWLVWCGTHWRVDDNGQAQRWMLDAIDQSCRAEQSAAWDKVRKAPKNSRDHDDWTQRALDLDRWRIKNLSSRAKGNSLEVAQQLSCLVVTNAQLDCDPFLFAVKNGWIDLRTSELHPHDPQQLYTRCCPIEYLPGVSDARWERFLLDFCGHTGSDSDAGRAAALEVLGFLQRFAGYCATGDTGEQAVLMLAGPGGNGKSLLSSCIQSILGGYAYPADFAIFLASHGDKRKWTLANLEKTRLVLCEESGEGKRFSSDLVKNVTGGTPIEAEAKGRQPFTYMPRFKVWFVTNHPPRVSDQDDGFWRRMKLVRADYIPPVRDRHLTTHLLQTQVAQQAILAWIVAGAALWHTGGLQTPPSIEHANSAYRAEQNPIADWLQERTVWSPEHQVPKATLRKDYMAWGKDQGIDPISARNFADRLRSLGADDAEVYTYNAETERSERGWSGLRLRINGTDNNVPGGPPPPARPTHNPDSSTDSSTAAATHSSRSDVPENTQPQPTGNATAPDVIGTNVLPQPKCGGSVAAQPSDASQIYDQPQQDYNSDGTSPRDARAHTHTGACAQRAHATRALSQSPAAAAVKEKRVPSGNDHQSPPAPAGGSRGDKLRKPPGPDEDLFAQAAPPERQPGDDEDEPPWDPAWGTAGPPPEDPPT